MPRLIGEARGAQVICWLHIGLAAAAVLFYVLLFGPRVGVPKLFEDGSLLLWSGLSIAVAAVPALLLFIPATRSVRAQSPQLFRSTILAGTLLFFHVAFVAYALFELSQATDL